VKGRRRHTKRTSEMGIYPLLEAVHAAESDYTIYGK
jgi:hypothetical protein